MPYENTVMEKPFPANLYFALTDTDMDAEKAPEDCFASMMYLVYRLKGNKPDVILSRFRDGLSYRKIGEMYGYTGSRAEGVISDCLKTMRENNKLVLAGIENTFALCKLSCEQREREKIFAECKDRYKSEGYEAGYEDGLRRNPREKTSFWLYKSIPLTDLNFSTRVRNAMVREQINTLADLLQRGNGIMKISSLGRKSLREIVETLNGLDLELDVRRYFNQVIVTYNIFLPANG